jgi:four helix bundle protein
MGKAEFKQFLGYAKGSAGETRSQALRATALHYVSVEDGRRLTKELVEISRMIHGLIKSLDR